MNVYILWEYAKWEDTHQHWIRDIAGIFSTREKAEAAFEPPHTETQIGGTSVEISQEIDEWPIDRLTH